MAVNSVAQARCTSWSSRAGIPKGLARAVGLRNVTAAEQCGPVALRFPPLSQGLDVAVQIACLGLCRPLIHPTGRLIQGLPAGEEQLRLSASGQLPKPVSRVSFGFVDYAPPGGWLLVLRSDGIRQQ
jgi:hypothetical protein